MARLGFCFSPKILNTKVRRNQCVCGEWVFLACVGVTLNSSVSHGNSTNVYRAKQSLHMNEKIAFLFFSCLPSVQDKSPMTSTSLLPICCNSDLSPGEVQTGGDEEFRMCLLLFSIFRPQEKWEGNVPTLRVLLEPLFPRGIRKRQQLLSPSHGLQQQLMGESLSSSSCLRKSWGPAGGSLSSDSCLRAQASRVILGNLPRMRFFPIFFLR